MKLGIGSYTYTWAIGVPAYPYDGKNLSAVDLINKAAEHGVQVVQICDNLPLHSLNEDELLEVKAAAEKLNICIEVGTRGVEPEHLRMYLRIAEFLNSDILRVILHKGSGAITVEEAYSYIREVLPEFEAKKIRIGIENHERHSVKDLAWLVEKLDSEYVGICLDTVNSFGALESPEQVISALAPYTINLHFKDFAISRLDHMMGFKIEGCPAGKGMLDTEKLLRLLREKAPDASVILELWTPFTENVEKTKLKESQWAYESINYLKEWVK